MKEGREKETQNKEPTARLLIDCCAVSAAVRERERETADAW